MLPTRAFIISNQKHLSHRERLLVGWQEWCALPDLYIPAIKAKIDTGAKTSSLHAFNIQAAYSEHNCPIVNFTIHPIQGNQSIVQHCQAVIVDIRSVKSSNGLTEHRYVISTTIQLGGEAWSIEVTLSNRDPLKFRMLLGREALNDRVLIDPKHSLCQGRISRKALHDIYPDFK